jgi:hypothetical protein
MHTVSGVSTVRIFTILSIGTAGITTRFTTILFIIPHIILHTIAGVGEVIGIRPTIAGDGVIHLITATGTGHIMLVYTADIMADIPIMTGMDTAAADILIQKITVTDNGVQPELMCFMVMTTCEGQALQESGHLLPLPKAPAKKIYHAQPKVTAELLPYQV